MPVPQPTPLFWTAAGLRGSAPGCSCYRVILRKYRHIILRGGGSGWRSPLVGPECPAVDDDDDDDDDDSNADGRVERGHTHTDASEDGFLHSRNGVPRRHATPAQGQPRGKRPGALSSALERVASVGSDEAGRVTQTAGPSTWQRAGGGLARRILFFFGYFIRSCLVATAWMGRSRRPICQSDYGIARSASLSSRSR